MEHSTKLCVRCRRRPVEDAYRRVLTQPEQHQLNKWMLMAKALVAWLGLTFSVASLALLWLLCWLLNLDREVVLEVLLAGLVAWLVFDGLRNLRQIWPKRSLLALLLRVPIL